MSLPLLAVLAVSTLTLLAALALWLRRPSAAAGQDGRVLELTAGVAGLNAQMARSEAAAEARFATLAQQLREDVGSLRRDLAHEAAVERESGSRSAADLRDEINRIVTHLGGTLSAGLADFRTHAAAGMGAHRADTTAAAEQLRTAVRQDLDSIGQRLQHFVADAGRHQAESRDALHTRLNELGNAQTAHQDRLRATVEERLNALNTSNAAKLDQMREVVDEKLHATLHTRLSESFGQVTDQLSKVHTGLGEMSKLSEGVDGLSRIFTNVKSRGGFAEVQLGMLLEQMLAPSQFVKNARIKPTSMECVEFAVRFPGAGGETLLPIDAKFPREDWERLETAYAEGTPEAIAGAGRAFEAAIRTEGRRICEKYIAPPVTTPYAVMFLPTEGLYAEVMRRDGLQAELQTRCRVTIAGPSTISAILSSFQMGFQMLAIQAKGDDVWKVLRSTQAEFGKFETLMDKMGRQVSTVQNTIEHLGVRTRAINRTLREVGEGEAPVSNVLAFEEAVPSLLPRLAAGGEEI